MHSSGSIGHNAAKALLIAAFLFLPAVAASTETPDGVSISDHACPASEYLDQGVHARGWKGELTLSCAREIYARARLPHAYPLPWISGYRISIPEVKTFLMTSGAGLHLQGAVIVGGLNFAALEAPALPDNEVAKYRRTSKYPRVNPPDLRVIGRESSLSIINSTFERTKGRDGVSLQLSNVLFKSTVYIIDSDMEEDVIADGAIFDGQLLIESSRFTRGLSLEGSTLLDAVISESEIQRDLSMNSALLAGWLKINHAVVGGSARFEGVVAVTRSRFTITHSEIKGNFTIERAKLDVALELQDLKFESTAQFGFATFAKDLILSQCRFEGVAHFVGTDVYGKVSLRQSKFNDLVDFRDTSIATLDWDNTGAPLIVRARVDVRDARSITRLVIADTAFDGTVDFSGATLGSARFSASATPGTFFRSVTFAQPVRFIGTTFSGLTEFSDVHFSSMADFTTAKFQLTLEKGRPVFLFDDVDFGSLKLSWKQMPSPDKWANERAELNTWGRESLPKWVSERLPPPHPVALNRAPTLGALESAFRAQGNLDDANISHFHLEVARSDSELHGSDWRLAASAWLNRWTWGWFAGYGTRADRVLCTALLLWLMGSLFFARSAHFYVAAPDAGGKEGIGLHLLKLPPQFVSRDAAARVEQSRWRIPLAAQFSLLLLLKIGNAQLRISPPHSRLLLTMLWIEWLLGYPMLAALVITLSNTQPILQGLIRALFGH